MKKKRNKKHTPRMPKIPMMLLSMPVLERFPDLATSLYGQIIAFCERPSAETSNNLSHQLACIAGGMSHQVNGVAIRNLRDAGSVAIVSAVTCIESIVHRYERVGVITVTEVEKTTLKAAAGKLDEVLQGMPLSCYLKAQEESHQWLIEAADPPAVAA